MPHAARPLLDPLTGALARGLAVLAMLVQVVFVAEHLGAAAVQAGGHPAPDARFGFLQICTGEGVALFDPVLGRVVGSGSHSDCAVCSSAAVCGFAAPEAPALPAPVPSVLTALEPAAFLPFAHIAPVPRSGLIRAPPAA